MKRSTWVLAAMLTVAAPAAAQTDSAAAQTLFDQGKALMDAGKYAEACPKLAESQRLDPAGGTLVHLATCHEQEGKLATAWGEFREAIDVAKRDKRADREAFSKKHADALAPKIAHLTIAVDGDPPPGLELRRDGTVIAQPSWGSPMPADRGSHTIEASAPGYKAWKQVVVVESDGATASITVPKLVLEEKAPGGAPVQGGGDHDERTWQRPLAVGVFGAGVIGVVVGTILGLSAKSKHDDAKSQCTLGPAGNGCTPDAVSLEDSARGAGTASTIAFIVGGVGLAGGTVLWFTAPSSGARSTGSPRSRLSRSVCVSTQLSPKRAGLAIEGTF